MTQESASDGYKLDWGLLEPEDESFKAGRLDLEREFESEETEPPDGGLARLDLSF